MKILLYIFIIILIFIIYNKKINKYEHFDINTTNIISSLELNNNNIKEIKDKFIKLYKTIYKNENTLENDLINTKKNKIEILNFINIQKTLITNNINLNIKLLERNISDYNKYFNKYFNVELSEQYNNIINKLLTKIPKLEYDSQYVINYLLLISNKIDELAEYIKSQLDEQIININNTIFIYNITKESLRKNYIELFKNIYNNIIKEIDKFTDINRLIEIIKDILKYNNFNIKIGTIKYELSKNNFTRLAELQQILEDDNTLLKQELIKQIKSKIETDNQNKENNYNIIINNKKKEYENKINDIKTLHTLRLADINNINTSNNRIMNGIFNTDVCKMINDITINNQTQIPKIETSKITYDDSITNILTEFDNNIKNGFGGFNITNTLTGFDGNITNTMNNFATRKL